ncbi:MAG TPA: insulinase family protein [Bacillota bacterium]|nr:insulinase family protein [Bacillota bacterium]
MKQGNVHGFTLRSIDLIPEAAVEAYEYLHEKSGLRLLLLQSDSTNKSFTIGFRTPPPDSTGVPHILEHSVLAGSKKYRTREPFMDMLRTSRQTFLNAMTFEDMTIYPLSSQDDQDFFNLISVYMDAVFFPRIYETEEIFLQEGWHFALEERNAPLTYNGVVYNEMRGAYGDPSTQIFYDIAKALHPGSSYSHESGGYPYDIPQLRYEDFLDFHRRYYHPSNALIVLHGAIDQDKLFPFFDEVLSEFTPSSEKIEIVPGFAPAAKHKFHNFEFNGEEGVIADKHSWLSRIWNLGAIESVEERFLAQLVYGVLVESESAPLKLALRASGLGEDIMCYSADTYYTDFGVLARNVNPARAEEFNDIIERELKRGVEQRFDADLLLAELNSRELNLRRSGGVNRGIIYSIRTLSRFRYGQPLLTDLAFDKPLKKLRADLGNGLFEDYVKKNILENSDGIAGIHRPVIGLYQRLDQDVAAELEQIKNGLSEEETDKLIEDTKALTAWQDKADTLEEKETLPYLSLADLDDSVAEIEQEIEVSGGIEYLLHPQSTGGIGTFALSFDLDAIDREDLVYVSYLARLLGDLSTSKRNYIELNNEIGKTCSGFTFAAGVSTKFFAPDVYKPRLIVRSHSLDAKIEPMFDLLQEVILETEFTDKVRLKELLLTVKSDYEDYVDNRAHQVAIQHSTARIDPVSAITEEFNGLNFYWHLCTLLADFDRKMEDLISGLIRVRDKIFLSNNMTVSLTAEEKRLAGLLQTAKSYLRGLPTNDSAVQKLDFSPNPLHEGLYMSSNVNYVTLCADFRKLGLEYDGSMAVLENLLSSDYLYQLIRAKGGAYGQGISLSTGGIMALSSYRDPKLAETVQVYKGLPAWLRAASFAPPELERIIIGSLNKFDPVISPYEVDLIMLGRRYSGLDAKTLAQLKAEAMATGLSYLHEAADWLEQAITQGSICVVGDEANLRASGLNFDQLTRLKRL